VAPQSVPDAYVQHAVSDFIATLGNTNPTNIEERYQQLSSMMSPALQVQFSAEANEWIAKVKAENISEMLTVLSKRVEEHLGGSLTNFYELEKIFEDAKNELPFFTKLGELHAWAASVYKETSDHRFRNLMFQIDFIMQQGNNKQKSTKKLT
jgi:hypothetical protein